MKYYINKTVDYKFEEASKRVSEVMMKNGFGVLTEINLHEKFKEKLNVDFRKYRILGTCNPKASHSALQFQDKLGTMLPCNVILQELEDGKVEIAAVDPVASMLAVEDENVKEIIVEVKKNLEKAISEI